MYIARLLDEDERSEFLEKWKECLDETMGSANFVPMSKSTKYLHALYALLENASQIGMEKSEHTVEIRKSYQVILAEMYRAAQGDDKVTKILQGAEEQRWSGSIFQLNPDISQTLRIVDKSDVIPTMLSRDAETLRAMVEALGEENMGPVRATVSTIINRNEEAREALRNHPGKLSVLGLSTVAVER